MSHFIINNELFSATNSDKCIFSFDEKIKFFSEDTVPDGYSALCVTGNDDIIFMSYNGYTGLSSCRVSNNAIEPMYCTVVSSRCTVFYPDSVLIIERHDERITTKSVTYNSYLRNVLPDVTESISLVKIIPSVTDDASVYLYTNYDEHHSLRVARDQYDIVKCLDGTTDVSENLSLADQKIYYGQEDIKIADDIVKLMTIDNKYGIFMIALTANGELIYIHYNPESKKVRKGILRKNVRNFHQELGGHHVLICDNNGLSRYNVNRDTTSMIYSGHDVILPMISSYDMKLARESSQRE